MTKTDLSRSRHDDNNEELYTIPGTDPLGVLQSTRVVVQQSQHVSINSDAADALCTRWLHEEQQHEAQFAAGGDDDLWDKRYHFFDGSERTVNWLLVLDALNFCFWAEKNTPRWTIEYQGETLNGYWAEAAALKRAVEEGIPLWDAKYLQQMSLEDLSSIFRGNSTIPLLEERLVNVREVGQILLKHYDGQFSHAITQVKSNAIRLVELLVRDFSSFRDIALYRNTPVRFLKRAQICVADLYYSFAGKTWGALTGLEQLTIFADYKLPQVLRHYSVLEYQASLAQRVDTQELLPAGSVEEIEIRAGTIWACELLKRGMQQRGRSVTAADIDQRLWLLGQDAGEMKPYHRTRTLYY